MVPGEGPQPARGMIVGEAPGRKEVEAGRPFVGRSGRLLRTVLNSCGIDPEQIYITNCVKDIPLTSEGKIRAPSTTEVESWRSILEGEIEATAPLSILALGRTAVQALTSIDGELVPFGSKVGNIYTAWHPAFLLRNGGSMQEWHLQIFPWAESLS